jgi:hypothetical protein
MTATELSAIAGVVLSLFFSYVPKINTWFASLASEYKRLIMLGVLLATALGVYGVSCLGWWPVVTCDQVGIKSLAEALLMAAIANQTAYSLSPQTSGVKNAKLLRPL